MKYNLRLLRDNIRNSKGAAAEWADPWPAERKDNETGGLKEGKAGAHFQSQGKSLAPVRALCKWALLTDSPFGFCKKKKEEEEEENSDVRV